MQGHRDARRIANAIAQRIVQQVVQDAFDQGHVAAHLDAVIKALGAEVDPLRVRLGQVAQQDIAYHFVQRDRFERQAGLRLVRARQGQQLVHQAARALLRLQDALQLGSPHRGIVVRQRVARLGPDTGQRRAQLMRDVAGKFALRVQAFAQARQQRVHSAAEPLHVLRGRILRQDSGQRRQVARVAAVQGLLQVGQRFELTLDDVTEPPRDHQQDPHLRQRRIRQQQLQQARAAARGLRHDDHELARVASPQADAVQRLAFEDLFGERIGGFRRDGRHRQPPIAGFEAAARAEHREVNGLALVEQHGAELVRRQVQPERAAFEAHVRRQRVGVVQQRAVERLRREMLADSHHQNAAQSPAQGERQQHVAPQPRRQARLAAAMARQQPSSST